MYVSIASLDSQLTFVTYLVMFKSCHLYQVCLFSSAVSCLLHSCKRCRQRSLKSTWCSWTSSWTKSSKRWGSGTIRNGNPSFRPLMPRRSKCYDRQPTNQPHTHTRTHTHTLTLSTLTYAHIVSVLTVLVLLIHFSFMFDGDIQYVFKAYYMYNTIIMYVQDVINNS